MIVRLISLHDAGNGWLAAVIELPNGQRVDASVLPVEEGKHELASASSFPAKHRLEIVETVISGAKEHRLI